MDQFPFLDFDLAFFEEILNKCDLFFDLIFDVDVADGAEGV